MIGVAADPAELTVVEEFFELFKTPWEPADPNHKYRVVLCTRGRRIDVDADLVLVYAADRDPVDEEAGVTVECRSGSANVNWGSSVLPVQNGLACFVGASSSPELCTGSVAVDYHHTAANRTIWRFGYDLFCEVRLLLQAGQPVANALTPTLDLHIEVLRHVLRRCGVPFVEVPPRPLGSDFICCLTHDVDFFGIKRHKLDRTLAGFVLRGSVMSVVDFMRGRRSLGDVAKNFWSVMCLPLVLAGWARDFWSPLDDYATADRGRPSTFFLIPFKNRPGLAPDGTVSRRRAVSYDASDVADDLRREAARGTELAVHGIDAWRDASEGQAERATLTSITAGDRVGVRMHWLYFSPESPRHLEAAGYAYDSTYGYNDAVGYRAGTAQAFRLPGSVKLLELPLTIMDTALFYPSRMGLTFDEGLARCRRIIENARQFGGVIVVNWHDRSLASERLWSAPYERLLREIDDAGRVWFATAGQAVQWFEWRRSIRFATTVGAEEPKIIAGPRPAFLPAAVARVCRSDGRQGTLIEDRPIDSNDTLASDIPRSMTAALHQVAH